MKKFLYFDESTGQTTESVNNTFETPDFINASTGVADANKPIITDSNGKIDGSLIDASEISHSSLQDLSNDDHLQYIRVDGVRAFTAAQSMGGNKLTNLANGTDTNDGVNFGQLKAVEDKIANLEFQDSVISLLADPPASPSEGDRYLVIAPATGSFAGKENQIATFKDGVFVFTLPTVGMFVSADNVSDRLYYYNGSAWVERFFESTTASHGLEKVGMDIRAKLAVNEGLEIDGTDSLKVKVSDLAGQGLKDDGSNNLELDFSTLYNDLKAISAADLNSNVVSNILFTTFVIK